MSAFFFRTRWLCADIGTAEHSRWRRLVDELAWRAIERDCDPREAEGPSVLRQALPLPQWVTGVQGPEFGRSVALYLKAMMRTNTDSVRLPGQDRTTSSVLDVHRNTVLAGYGDLIALVVRFALQLPDHFLIDPGDKAWLADLIERGRTTPWPAEVAHDPTAGLPLFDHDGWGHVVELLRADDKDTAVVTYELGDSPFPSQIWAGRPGEDREVAYRWWRAASRDQKWAASERGLREHAAQHDLPLFLSPDTLHVPAFSPDPGLTWHTLAAAWRQTTP